MKEPAPRPVEKKKARDADMVFHASAGTGKTHALVSKYVSELLRRGDGGYVRVDQLVAITFTEKAAAEMKERVRDKLADKIEKLRKETKADASTANLPEDAPGWGEKEKMLAHLVRQRQALQGAYISTIHSFCARLLRENPIAAGVDPAFSVMDEMEAAELLEKTAVNAVLKALRDGRDNVARLTRDLGFKSPGGAGGGLVNQIVNTIPLARAANKTPQGLLSDYERFLAALDGAEAEAARDALFSLVPRMRGAGKNTRVYKLTEAMRERPELFAEPSDLSPAGAVALAGLASGLKSSAGGEEIGKLLFKMAAPALERAAEANTRAFLEIMGEVMRDYSRAKEKKSLLDYDDLQEKARVLLKKETETGRILSGKFKRVMVDEFQDINDLQQEIISLLSPPGAGGLFIVGDVKQSIYGFRGADVTVFGQVAGRVRENGGHEYSLTKNFRSSPGLISFINGFFPMLMKGGGPEAARFDPEKDSLRPRFKDIGPEKAVTRLSFKIDDGRAEDYRALEAATIASFIAEEIGGGGIMVRGADGRPRPAGFGDVALLLRKFTCLGVYENAFRFAEVPYQALRGKGFYHAQEVRDFISLLKALDYSRDSLALMSVLRSPLAGLSDAAILRMARGEDGAAREAPEDFILKKKTPPGLDGEDREKLKTFAERFRRWRRARDKMMISELLETIIAETGYGAVMISRFHGEQRLANLFKLIEMARRFESDKAKGLKNFIQRLSRLEGEESSREPQAETSSSGEAVTILTAHQSKGLEFPIVIVGDLGGGERGGGDRIAFHHAAGVGLKVYDPESGEWAGGPMFEKVRAARKDAEEAELERLLYVAMTRARDRLILSGSSRNGGKWERWVDGVIAAAGLDVETVEVSSWPEVRRTWRRRASIAPEAIAARRPPAPVKKKKRRPSRPEIKITATGLAALRHCPRLYYYQNVMKLPPPRTNDGRREDIPRELSPISLGARVHALLEKAPLGQGTRVEALEAAVADEFADLDEKRRREISENLRMAFSSPVLSELFSTPPEAILREIPMALRLAAPRLTVTVAGTADIAWFNGDEWKAADYKYSERPASETRYVFQLKLYAYTLMERMEMDSLGLSLVYLKEKESQVSSIRVLRADLKGFRKTILDAAALVARLDGRPEREWMTIGEDSCAEERCPYSGRCHAGG